MKIREDIAAHMAELKAWLKETEDQPPEEMGSFFTARLDGYEEHMSEWKEAYRRVGKLIPADCKALLDLGCGTGLELDEIFKRLPDVTVTGIDLCLPMLERLREKHTDKNMTLRCEDYLKAELGQAQFDAVVSVESLHHLKPEKKKGLYERICHSLKPGGVFYDCDYIACCDEEEELLFAEAARRRRKAGVTEEEFIHFDTPLTLGHELGLLRQAGFAKIEAIDSIHGATILAAWR